MFKHIEDRVALAERAAADGGLDGALRHLRRLSLADFGGLLLEMPNHSYPTLSSVLPRMASVEVQQSWTGSSGRPLLHDTLAFVRILKMNYEEITGRSLRDACTLDYGCGYGRIARLMTFFNSPGQFYGVDPWHRSIEICQADGVLGTLAVSDYLPASLPVSDVKFDLIYSYSVFTHTSMRATKAALTTLRKYIARHGVLIVTIRPIEYWDVHFGVGSEQSLRLTQAHSDIGFAFEPHNREPVDGEITYGDTSMDESWLRDQFPEWELRTYDRGSDYHQTILFLTPS